MINLTNGSRAGFGLLELLGVLVLIALLYFCKPYILGQSKGGQGYIEQRLAMKKQAESQVKNIQGTLKKRYQSYQ